MTQTLIKPLTHEVFANINYNANGLSPWFAADRMVKDNDGSVETTLQAVGHEWNVSLYYQDSALLPPGKTDNGTEIQQQQIREFRLHCKATDDDVGQRTVNYHIRPRWPNMKAENDDGTVKNVPVPDALVDGQDAVNIRANGSNLPIEDYEPLLRSAAQAVGFGSGYFEDPHSTSNIQEAARYVRIRDRESGPLHGRDGPLARLGHVLETDRSGYRKVVQDDTNDNGGTKPGYYHTTTLGPDRINHVWPDHNHAKEFKHYYEKDYQRRSGPLKHPKLEVSLQGSRQDHTAYWSDRQQLITELDEAIYALLADAGLSLRSDGTFVEDAYFDADDHDPDATVVDLNVQAIKQEQEHIVVRELSDGLSPTQWDSLDVLVTDGGEVSPADIAAEKGRHVDSVRRALREMDDLVEREYGRVSIESSYVAELVHEAVDAAEDHLTRAANAAEHALQAAERGIDEKVAALHAWADRYGVDLRRHNGDMEIDLGEWDHNPSTAEIRRVLRQGLELWTDAKKDEVEFRDATWHLRHPTTSDLESIDRTDSTETVAGAVWSTLSRG